MSLCSRLFSSHTIRAYASHIFFLSFLLFSIDATKASDGFLRHSTKFSFLNRVFFSEKRGKFRKACQEPTLQDYACSVSLSPNYIMHWKSDNLGVNFALNVSTQGWVSLGFAQFENSMSPSDAVIFTTDISGANPSLNSARISGRSLSQILFENNFQINDMEIEKNSSYTFIKFRRKFGDGSFPIFSSNVTHMNWAYSANDLLNLAFHNENKGSISLRFDSSSAPFHTKPENEKKYKIHGWLMWLVFTILIPFGIIFASSGHSILNIFWSFHLHIAFQITGVILATISAFVLVFNDKNHALEFDSIHEKIGWSIIVILWFQVILGIIRKKLKKNKNIKPFWNILHVFIGIFIILLAWSNIFLGFDMYNKHVGEVKAWKIVVVVQIILWILLYTFFSIFRIYYPNQSQPIRSHPLSNQSFDFDLGNLPSVQAWERSQVELQSNKTTK